MSDSRFPMTSNRSTGRPRDETLDTAIMRAAIDLVDERGYAAVTIDAIAERAKTSKTAIYRRWPKKAAIVMEAFLVAAEPLITPPDNLPFRDTVIAQMTALAKFFQTTPGGRTITDLIAVAQTDAALADAIRENWLIPRRTVACAYFQAAQKAGELRDGIDSSALIDALYGPLYFRLLLGHDAIDKSFIEHIVDMAMMGIAPNQEKSS
ncbi:TetR/AcrR family transcriptional regulator [Pandoraea sp. XJJ-1]|uniref:Bacterial regulatory protein, tetR family n=2 Tax=Variovorax paradoxus TaxID=34073 RepID=A0A0H2MBL7_VARPD|nr:MULTISPECIES: TetR/AcrR family transcriptional regulator [Pseudomonadota]KLN58052.1 bacterial regulatory protein, tetR family [Variovorax paradoxus]MBL0607634.1 TetR/AcrR family transcriptional regulator [Aeromonas caviae]WAL82171.1 TetR/AcrR family transcriptional regulator [Pandoraea sp. XJJ-1]HCI1918322.1 TetR/AcrR family transcriptional regulator [Pseudomonas aeruginosa]